MQPWVGRLTFLCKWGDGRSPSGGSGALYGRLPADACTAVALPVLQGSSLRAQTGDLGQHPNQPCGTRPAAQLFSRETATFINKTGLTSRGSPEEQNYQDVYREKGRDLL